MWREKKKRPVPAMEEEKIVLFDNPILGKKKKRRGPMPQREEGSSSA